MLQRKRLRVRVVISRIAEAKIFNPDRGKGKPYLIQAFQQTYLYACDHNQPVGYIVIFNTSDTQLRFALSASGEPVPHVVLNNKVIFFSEVDIFPHAESASRRKPLKAVEVTEEEIVEGVHRPHG